MLIWQNTDVYLEKLEEFLEDMIEEIKRINYGLELLLNIKNKDISENKD